MLSLSTDLGSSFHLLAHIFVEEIANLIFCMCVLAKRCLKICPTCMIHTDPVSTMVFLLTFRLLDWGTSQRFPSVLRHYQLRAFNNLDVWIINLGCDTNESDESVQARQNSNSNCTSPISKPCPHHCVSLSCANTFFSWSIKRFCSI